MLSQSLWGYRFFMGAVTGFIRMGLTCSPSRSLNFWNRPGNGWDTDTNALHSRAKSGIGRFAHVCPQPTLFRIWTPTCRTCLRTPEEIPYYVKAHTYTHIYGRRICRNQQAIVQKFKAEMRWYGWISGLWSNVWVHEPCMFLFLKDYSLKLLQYCVKGYFRKK